MTRWEHLIALCPHLSPVVDVGADHGRVAAALGAIAVERQLHRVAGPGTWVIADGLRPFREVGTAIIAGMGARKIAAILEAGPRPRAAVLHAQDDPGWLRRWLVRQNWRIDAEALAIEGQGFAEVIRVFPGVETSSDEAVFFGPRLIEGDDPLRQAWLSHHLDLRMRRIRAIPPEHRDAEKCQRELEFLQSCSRTKTDPQQS